MGGALASGVAFFDTFVASASLRGLGASDGNGSRPPVFYQRPACRRGERAVAIPTEFLP
eukprot:contig_20254_g4990